MSLSYKVHIGLEMRERRRETEGGKRGRGREKKKERMRAGEAYYTLITKVFFIEKEINLH